MFGGTSATQYLTSRRLQGHPIGSQDAAHKGLYKKAKAFIHTMIPIMSVISTLLSLISNVCLGENLFTLLIVVICSCILVGIMMAVAIVIYR